MEHYNQHKAEKREKRAHLVKSNYFLHQDIIQKIQSAPPASGPSVAHTVCGGWHPGPAHEWDAAGQHAGLQVWRIEKFQCIAWPPQQYGKFYSGDSYVVLRTIEKDQVKFWDIHFWLGESTTTDEAGTAAYKTVELDQKLGGEAKQHREVQGYESQLFLSYFKPSIHILTGGVESGFNHVKPEEYTPRLLHVKGKFTVRTEQVPLSSHSLNSADVFILDAGLAIYVWQGAHATAPEKFRADQIAEGIKDERNGRAEITVFEENVADDNKAKFWAFLGGEGPIAPASQGGDDAEAEMQGTKCMFKLSDDSGSLQFTEVARGRVVRSLLDTHEVFVFDTGSQIFVWTGRRASVGERTHALSWAQQYLTKFNRPPYLPISKVFEDGDDQLFDASFD